MMWICRAGINAIYFDHFLNTSKIYLPWEGYNTDFSGITTRDEFKQYVIQEKGEVARTSIANWSGQLYSFCVEMQEGDYVLVPHKHSHKYELAIVVGPYEYCKTEEMALWHSRHVDYIKKDIPRDIFPQSIQYSLGAYRTVFKTKNTEEILRIINDNKR